MSLSMHLRHHSARDAGRIPREPRTPAAPSHGGGTGRRRALSAQGMVEFAIIGPVFFFMLFGLIDLGRAVWTSHELASGTREGSRYVMVNGTAATWDGTNPITARVLDSTTALAAGNLTVAVTGAPGTVGGFATVRTTYRFDFIVSQIIGRGTVTLTQQSRVVIQS